MILVTCASKLTLSIFFVGAFVLAQFWAIASIISWSLKKLIFLIKTVKIGDFVSVISPWKRSPRLKFGGPKRTSRTGQEDGWENKRKKSFLRGKFCCAKSPFFWQFFRFFGRFAIFLAIFGPFLGRYKVCWVDLRLPTTKRVKLQYIFSVSVSFLATFFVIFGKFFGFYRYFIAFFAILSVFLGIFSGIQDGVLPVAPIGE